MSFEYFVRYICAPSILVLGLMGNLFSLIVLSNKKFNKIGPRYMLKYLFAMDTIYLVQIMFNYMTFAYNMDFSKVSNLTCKFYFYMNYSLDPISSMLLVYLSIDRLISIKYPSKKFFFRKYKTQLVYFLLIVAFNLIFYIPIIFYVKIHESPIENSTEIYYFCNFLDDLETQTIILLVDLIVRIVIPFLLMILCSILLIVTIVKSRAKVLTNNVQLIKVLKRDFKFGITSICLNSVYMIFNIPVILVFSVNEFFTQINYEFTLYIFYIPYGVNFYLLVLSNAIFRNEFLHKFSIKK